jgi:hypothetical protein
VSVSQAFPPLGPEFEPFLYSIVCEEPNGMPLTVVSVIARSGADPWKEAARIAKLPRDAAYDALAGMIPGGADAAATAERLLALLPVARENPIRRVIVSQAFAGNDATRWSPLVPIVLALLLGLALVTVFSKSPHPDAGQPQPAASEPQADKTDP